METTFSALAILTSRASTGQPRPSIRIGPRYMGRKSKPLTLARPTEP